MSFQWRKVRQPGTTAFRTIKTKKAWDAYLEDEIDATEPARKLAKEKGVSLADIEGSGEGGRILKSDVEG